MHSNCVTSFMFVCQILDLGISRIPGLGILILVIPYVG